MKKMITLAFGLGLSVNALAVDCTSDRGSCFRVFNNFNKGVRLICFESTKHYPFLVSVRKNNESSLNLDPQSNDGLGSPMKDTISCYLSFNGESEIKRFNFLNPYHGAAVEVIVNSGGDGVMVVARNKDNESAEYTFNI